MNDYKDFDFLDFDTYTSSTEDSKNTSNTSWWDNFTNGATNVINSIGDLKPKVETDLKFDMNQLTIVGLGALALILLTKK